MFLLIHCATFGNHQQRCTLIHKRYKLFMLFRECVCVAFFNILFIPFEAQRTKTVLIIFLKMKGIRFIWCAWI